MQHLLLGVNTHINLDLAIATATVAPGNSIYALHNDFNKINDLISSLMDDIEESLCKVWMPMRLLLKATDGKQDAVLNFSVEKARMHHGQMLYCLQIWMLHNILFILMKWMLW